MKTSFRRSLWAVFLLLVLFPSSAFASLTHASDTPHRALLDATWERLPAAARALDLTVEVQDEATWERTKRERRLPKDAVAEYRNASRWIVLLATDPDLASSLVHEVAHAYWWRVLTQTQRDEFTRQWREFGYRLPWEPAKQKVEEGWAYVFESLYGDGGEAGRAVRRLVD